MKLSRSMRQKLLQCIYSSVNPGGSSVYATGIHVGLYEGNVPTQAQLTDKYEKYIDTSSNTIKLVGPTNMIRGIDSSIKVLGFKEFFTPRVESRDYFNRTFLLEDETIDVVIEGNITFLVVQPLVSSNIGVGITFIFSVGTIGSGADIEMDSTSTLSTGTEVRLNNISIDFSIGDMSW